MINKILFKLVVIFLLAFGIYGCTKGDEANKLGFSTVKEMSIIQSKGWHTKYQYDSDMAMLNEIAQEKKRREDAIALKLAQSLKLAQENKKREDETNLHHDNLLKRNDWFLLSEKIGCIQGAPLTLKNFYLKDGIALTENWDGTNDILLLHTKSRNANFLFFRDRDMCKIFFESLSGQ